MRSLLHTAVRWPIFPLSGNWGDFVAWRKFVHCTVNELFFVKKIIELKWTVSKDFQHFFIKQIPPGPHIKRQQRFHEIFRFQLDICENMCQPTWCQRGQWLSWHLVSIVNSYVDIMSMTKHTLCQCSQRLRRHEQDYADTFGKLWSLLTDFKGTIRWKKYLCVFKNPIAII